MAGFGFLLGGALAGGGDALAKRAEDARKESLLNLEAAYNERGDVRRHGFALEEEKIRDANARARDDITAGRAGEREDISHTYRLEEQALQDKSAAERERIRAGADAGDISHYETSADNEVVGFDKRGRSVKTGVKVKDKIDTSDKDRPADIEDAIVKRNTATKETKPDFDNPDGPTVREPVVNYKKVADELDARGMKDRASVYRSLYEKNYRGGGRGLVEAPRADLDARPESTAPRAKLPAGVTAESALDDARATIQARPGARKGVIDRLRSWGVDTSGL